MLELARSRDLDHILAESVSLDHTLAPVAEAVRK